MSSPAEIPTYCLSAMALRVEGCVHVALEAAGELLSSIGTITKQRQCTLSCDVTHPDGRAVKVKVIAYRVFGDADYLELQRRHGDALLGADVYRMLVVRLSTRQALG